jgi:uncharacterized protein (DUF3084 family)
MRYLDPKNDPTFKKIFCEHPDILMDLLNSLEAAQKELALANEQLAIANKELTAANEQLAIANKELTSANEQLAIAEQKAAEERQQKINTAKMSKCKSSHLVEAQKKAFSSPKTMKTLFCEK